MRAPSMESNGFWKMTELSGKRLAVFATGAMPPDLPEPEKALKQNFSEEEWQKLKVFYLPSGLNYKKWEPLTGP